MSPDRQGPGGLTRPIRPGPDPLPLHRTPDGEPVVGIVDLIEWLLVNEPADLPVALTAGIGRLPRTGGSIILPAELDALQPTIVPEFEPGSRRGEGLAPA